MKKEEYDSFLGYGLLDFIGTHRKKKTSDVTLFHSKEINPLPNPGYQKDRTAKGFTQIDAHPRSSPWSLANGPSWMCLKYFRPKMHWFLMA